VENGGESRKTADRLIVESLDRKTADQKRNT
jgi:hypothetical protein